MSFIAPLIGLVGTGISAVGSISSGNAAEAAAKNNAAVAVEEAQIKEDQQRLQDKVILARGRALVGSSGVEMTGSPLDIMAESARQAEINALIIRRGGQLDAQSQLLQGAAAKKASLFNAAGTILTRTYNVGKQLSTLGQNSSSGSSGASTTYDPNTGLMT